MATAESFGLPKKAYTKHFWGGMFFSAVCLFWFIGGLPWLIDSLSSVIIGGVGALVFVPVTVWAGIRMIRGTPTATISEKGLEVPGIFIRWSEISCLRRRNVWGSPWIDVVLHEPYAVISRASLLRRPNMYLNTWLFKSPVLVSPSHLDEPKIFLIMAGSYVPIR